MFRISVHVRRFKSDMVHIVSRICRLFRITRTCDVWKYVQYVTTVLIVAYFVDMVLTGVSTDSTEKTTHVENQDKPDISLKKERQLLTTHAPTVEAEHKRLKDKLVFKRIDTKPELTEKLPFMPNYKSPCWEELDEVLEPEIRLSCLPYFYVIGVSQCGTKELFTRLVMHPLISSNVKAGNRWLTRLRFAGYPKLSDYLQYYYHAVETDLKTITTKTGYHNAIFGDFTPSVIWDNRNMLAEAKKLNMSDPPYTNADVIKNINPNARIIALLCNPTDRLYADFRQTIDDESTVNIKKFHEHVQNSVNRFSGCLKNSTLKKCVYFGRPWHTTYRQAGLTRLEIGLYNVHLDNFMKLFPKNQILVIKKETFDKDIINTLQEIFTFLDVGKVTDKYVLDMMKRGDAEDVREDIQVTSMLPETRKLLQDFYRPYNKLLAQSLGKNFDYNIA